MRTFLVLSNSLPSICLYSATKSVVTFFRIRTDSQCIVFFTLGSKLCYLRESEKALLKQMFDKSNEAADSYSVIPYVAFALVIVFWWF